MIKVGITGQAGFIGTHLYNTLGLFPEQYTRIPFEDSFFANTANLNDFARQCDVIVHLAALNRHNDPNIIYETNISLVKQLINAMENTKSTPYVLFSSSSQEERDNPYGRSKKEGRILLEEWAIRNSANFTGLIIPNVFGPFGNPYYNSVVATFCYQLAHDETPKIEIDGELKLIYVGELVTEIISGINKTISKENKEKPLTSYNVPYTKIIKVSEILKTLNEFKKTYFEKGMIPNLDDPFIRNLFNTFLCYIDHKKFYPFNLKLNTDNRGSFVETIKLNSGGQVSFSTTVPGITRGNHLHTRKAERFAVIKGKARIDIRRIGTNEVISFYLDGAQPSFVDIPIWFTHNITNTGTDDLYTIFWISEHFDANDPDTFFENV